MHTVCFRYIADNSLLSGDESGGFSFTVTDGEHTSPLYQFVVTARPLTITMVTQEELMVFPGKTQASHFSVRYYEGSMFYVLCYQKICTDIHHMYVNNIQHIPWDLSG